MIGRASSPMRRAIMSRSTRWLRPRMVAYFGNLQTLIYNVKAPSSPLPSKRGVKASPMTTPVIFISPVYR
jgi:hypothetical protein